MIFFRKISDNSRYPVFSNAYRIMEKYLVNHNVHFTESIFQTQVRTSSIGITGNKR